MILVDCPDLCVGGSARPVCPGSANRSTAMFQAVEKHEATQAIICTILSASNTSLWRLLLKGFFTEERGGRGRDSRVSKTNKNKKH